MATTAMELDEVVVSAAAPLPLAGPVAVLPLPQQGTKRKADEAIETLPEQPPSKKRRVRDRKKKVATLTAWTSLVLGGPQITGGEEDGAAAESAVTSDLARVYYGSPWHQADAYTAMALTLTCKRTQEQKLRELILTPEMRRRYAWFMRQLSKWVGKETVAKTRKAAAMKVFFGVPIRAKLDASFQPLWLRHLLVHLTLPPPAVAAAPAPALDAAAATDAPAPQEAAAAADGTVVFGPAPRPVNKKDIVDTIRDLYNANHGWEWYVNVMRLLAVTTPDMDILGFHFTVLNSEVAKTACVAMADLGDLALAERIRTQIGYARMPSDTLRMMLTEALYRVPGGRTLTPLVHYLLSDELMRCLDEDHYRCVVAALLNVDEIPTAKRLIEAWAASHPRPLPPFDTTAQVIALTQWPEVLDGLLHQGRVTSTKRDGENLVSVLLATGGEARLRALVAARPELVFPLDRPLLGEPAYTTQPALVAALDFPGTWALQLVHELTQTVTPRIPTGGSLLAKAESPEQLRFLMAAFPEVHMSMYMFKRLIKETRTTKSFAWLLDMTAVLLTEEAWPDEADRRGAHWLLLRRLGHTPHEGQTEENVARLEGLFPPGDRRLPTRRGARTYLALREMAPPLLRYLIHGLPDDMIRKTMYSDSEMRLVTTIRAIVAKTPVPAYDSHDIRATYLQHGALLSAVLGSAFYRVHLAVKPSDKGVAQ